MPYITPTKAGLLGLRLIREMKELNFPGDVRKYLPGMPSGAFTSNHRWLTPGLEFYGETVCVIWSHDPELKPEELRDKLWQRIKLSVYYALKEEEAAKCRAIAEAASSTLNEKVFDILAPDVI